MAEYHIDCFDALMNQTAQRIAHSFGRSAADFLKVLDALEAADFAEFCEHPDVIELDVATASWYPAMEER